MTAPRVTDLVAAALDRIAADGRDGIWISLVPAAGAMAAAAAVERRLADGEHLPLAGRTLAVKDNIDVAGLPTTAACPAYAYEPTDDAAVVRALVAAGAVVVGKTNMDQFATGLVGTRSPYGVCPNAHWPDLISGGSSSGSAVAVAAGLVDLALGTDTAGSGRVPAAANAIVGFKPTRGRLSTAGVMPACRSLDCVSVFAPTVAEAADVATLAAAGGPDQRDPWSRAVPATRLMHPGRLRLGVPRRDVVPGFRDTVEALVDDGFVVELVETDLEPFLAAGRLLYDGAFVAERYDAVGAFVEQHAEAVDPVVASIVLASGRLPAWQVFRDQSELRCLARRVSAGWASVDLLALPTVPGIPTVAEVLADPVGVNTRLGTYTAFVNLLDLAALTFPVGPPDRTAPGPPVSVSLIGPAGADDLLAAVGDRLMPPDKGAIRRIG